MPTFRSQDNHQTQIPPDHYHIQTNMYPSLNICLVFPSYNPDDISHHTNLLPSLITITGRASTTPHTAPDSMD